MRNKRLKCLLVVALLGYGKSTTAIAAENNNNAQAFSYEVIQPDNQANSQVGYFDLKMEPGQGQTTRIKLFNPTTKALRVGVALNSAKTTSRGQIEYGPNEIVNDPSLQHDFRDLVRAPAEVTIPAEGETTLELEIQLPATPFAGIIAGGIQLQQLDNTDGGGEKVGVLTNTYSYLIGMLLRVGNQPASEELVFNHMHATLVAQQNVATVNISNTQAAYVDELTIEVAIRKVGTTEVLLAAKRSEMRMAPNSHIDFPVVMAVEEMPPGEYQAEIIATTEAGGRWLWHDTFTIGEPASQEQPQSGKGWVSWQAGLVLVSLLAVVLFLYLKRASRA